MAHEFGCSMLCWLKPALGIEFIIIFRFFVSRLNDEFPCLHFRRLFFVFTQKAIEKVSPVFKMLFVIKNANRKTIFRVFLNTLLPAIPYATQLDLRFEKHMPCYVHRTQILNLTSAKGNSGATFRQLVDNWSGGSGGLHPTSPFLCRQPKREPKNIYTEAVIFCQTARVGFWFLGCLDRSHHYCNKWFHWFKRVEYFPVFLAHRWG